MSLCPHGYTAFWDCSICPEPLGTAQLEPICDLCRLPVDRCHCRQDEQLAGELPRPWPNDVKETI